MLCLHGQQHSDHGDQAFMFSLSLVLPIVRHNLQQNHKNFIGNIGHKTQNKDKRKTTTLNTKSISNTERTNTKNQV
jgi:hypothetical protein